MSIALQILFTIGADANYTSERSNYMLMNVYELYSNTRILPYAHNATYMLSQR